MDRPRILLADDHPAMLDRVSHQLNGEFEIVATVLDGQAALDAILVQKPDAVVLDISMPRVSGLEVAKRLSAMANPPVVVFLSVYEDPDFIAAAKGAGASGYVIKRNVRSHLVPALKRALAH
jgi:CheY-like chemotaxis protein